jgi:ABC-type multidrug transport system fused ATPase/permease subunit
LELELHLTTDTALIEKREELKRRLAAGEYKTLVDIFLEWFDRLIRKVTRRPGPIPLWVLTAILSFALTLMDNTAIYVAGDWSNLVNWGGLIGFEHGAIALRVILNHVFYIASLVVINQYIVGIFIFWRDNMLDVTASAASLVQFEDWLEKVCNWRWHFLTAIIGGLLGGSYLVAILDARFGVFIGYGLTVTCIVLAMVVMAFLYLFLMIILLAARLRRYDLKLFAADPSNSELVSRLSGELSVGIYLVALFASIQTLSTAPTGFLPTFGILLVLIYWLPIITVFILNQTSLSSIIRRAKWKTLNEIQSKVEKLQAVENFEDKETMEAINRLMDYHDRVKATRNSALDLNTTLHFINSLLLPLLAFLLGNLDKLTALLQQNP